MVIPDTKNVFLQLTALAVVLILDRYSVKEAALVSVVAYSAMSDPWARIR